MIVSTGKRILTLVTVGFALMGFVAVPIFEKTAYHRVCEFFDSKDAPRPTSDMSRTLAELKSQLDDELRKHSEGLDSAKTNEIASDDDRDRAAQSD